jgi:hypothetical protein
MTKYEQKNPFMLNDKKAWKSVAVEVSKIIGTPHEAVYHCHGAVRVHKQRVTPGPKDHVEHLSRLDSTYCIGGMHYKGGGANVPAARRLDWRPAPTARS